MSAFLFTGCGGSSPDVPVGADGEPDVVLEAGRDIYGSRCSSCHGAAGQGGRGKRLNEGAVLAAYPDIDDLIAVIAGGKGSGMPAFDSLSGSELDAVARYVREVLN